MASYVTVKLPKKLVDQIDAVIEQQNLGYASRAELVKDAIRAFLSGRDSAKKP
jgi:metal-responsive CopG/Arc/MetJ family transcriptional regulator